MPESEVAHPFPGAPSRPVQRFIGAGTFLTMGKILFWIAVFFAILFALRLINLAKTKARAKDEGSAPPKAIPPAEPTVRCIECGIFLPKSESVPAATGYRCGDPGCPRRL